MEYLPLFFKLAGQPVLVVGGGTLAARKTRLLTRAGAQVRLVSPTLCEELDALVTAGKIEWLESTYSPDLLNDVRLVVAATNDSDLNQWVYDNASERSLPVNVVDAPELCSVIFPSIVDRDPLLVAISSSGRSPVLARILRRKIEALIPAAYGRLAEFSGRFRNRVKEQIPEETPRRLFWEQALEGSVAESILAGRDSHAVEAFEEMLGNTQALYKGEVYLVGAGPGDPDLLTFKAARLLQSADVVLYDRLVSPAILDMARRDAQRIYVGKRRADHTLPQTEINALLLQLAQQGKRVIRLKGGDPFIFGRGGEEIELLAQHRVPFQVVPGITAANGAASYSGIPLTHRDHAQSVRFVAGHLKGNSVDHDWAQFSSPTETLVFYMGLQGLSQICQNLQDAGRDSSTPVALIEKATTAEQRVLTGTLASIGAIVEKAHPKAPTLLIIGDVVNLHQNLAWFGEQNGSESR